MMCMNNCYFLFLDYFQNSLRNPYEILYRLILDIRDLVMFYPQFIKASLLNPFAEDNYFIYKRMKYLA